MFAPFVENFDFIYNSLTELSDDQIRLFTNQFLAANFLAMKHFYDQVWLEKNLRTLLSQFIEGKSKLNSQFYVYVLNFVKLKKQEIMELLSTMPTEQTKEILSTYDQLMQEGIQKGLEKGLKKGRQQNLIEVVVSCWHNKLELDLIASITKLSVEQVKEILSQQKLI